MKRQGVLYDTGRVLYLRWRPVFDPDAVRRDLRVIRDELHCTAVRVCGRDVDRLTFAAQEALRLGLEVWFSPELWDRSWRTVVRYLGPAAARAEQLRRRHPDRVVLSVASEATMFVRGIVPGLTFQGRARRVEQVVRAGRHAAPLTQFLDAAERAARREFGGPVTYASLPFEPVDWACFDIVSVDHYRDARTAPRYQDTLRRLSGLGKPVVVTEFGMRTFHGADLDGRWGDGITDWRSVMLHRLPLVGRLVRPRLLPGGYVRDEEMQARAIAENLVLLDQAGVDGAFVCQFDEPMSPHDPDPRYDLDMSALSLVKTYANGHGISHPGVAWEPKRAFRAVADFYGKIL
jgi:hypothetical protein